MEVRFDPRPAQRPKGSSIATAAAQVTAAAQIQSPVWELPNATGVALKGEEKKDGRVPKDSRIH